MSGMAGNIFPGNTGYLQIGLTNYDIKIVASTKEQHKEGESKLRLVQFDRRKNEIKKDLCGLTKETASTGNIYFYGVLNIGFANMELKIWNVDKEKRKSEESPIMFIVGSLQTEKNESNKKGEIKKESGYQDVDLMSLASKTNEPTITVFQSPDDMDHAETIISDIPDF